MPRKAIMHASDSQNQAVLPLPRREGYLTLTVTGYQAAKLLNADPDDIKFSQFCKGCLRPVSMCSCPIDER